MTESKKPQTVFESCSVHNKLSMVSATILALQWAISEGLDDADSITDALNGIDHLLTCAMRELQGEGKIA